MSPLLGTDEAPPGVTILDIRADKEGGSLVDLVQQTLNPGTGQSKSLPSFLLYDEKGLKLFEKITYLEEYYLTNAEIDTLNKHADAIAARIPAGTRLIELGSGNLRKVNIFLQAFERAQKQIEYYALDLSLSELHRTFAKVDIEAFKYVSLNALHGTYDDGLAWLTKDQDRTAPVCLMSMGSSMGNFDREGAAQFLANFANILKVSDFIVIGLDACQDPDRIFDAYNDKKHVTEDFYRNGLEHINHILQYTAFEQDAWTVETSYDPETGKHEAFYVSKDDLENDTFSVKRGERIHVEDAHKYSQKQSDALWHDSGLILQESYANDAGDYNLHLLSPAKIDFSDKPLQYANTPLPTLDDWHNLWAAWDIVTRSMVPREELLNKPIALRNQLIFYLGHIPAFADIHYTRATSAKPTDPAFYHNMFERGVDPDVDNPQICHSHSEIPDEYPPVGDILAYQQRVRDRITTGTKEMETNPDRRLARGLWLAYEHEAMHLETFLYMLLYSEKVIPPPNNRKVDFRSLAIDAAERRAANQWSSVPASEITLGLDDPENDLGPDRYFGWDVERPSRKVNVKAFEAHNRPISNGEYARFLEETKTELLPASWIASNQIDRNKIPDSERSLTSAETASSDFIKGKSVRTVYGPVPLQYALDWPVMASYDELAAFAQWSGGRIPTFEETVSIYSYVQKKRAEAEQVPSSLISAVNGHLSNDGVEETPPSGHNLHKKAPVGLSFNPPDTFIDLQGCNVSFKSWHPQPVTGKSERLCGQSDTGGLWEWTSTPLAAHSGYKPMELYPGYSADFFDDKHNICLGGSWATVPRIAGRKAPFVNWFQRNYPYVWCTTRLVRDV